MWQWSRSEGHYCDMRNRPCSFVCLYVKLLSTYVYQFGRFISLATRAIEKNSYCVAIILCSIFWVNENTKWRNTHITYSVLLLNLQTWVRKISPIVGNSTSFAVAFTSQRDDGAPYSITVMPEQLGLYHAKGYNLVDLYNTAKVFESILSNQPLTVRINPSGMLFLIELFSIYFNSFTLNLFISQAWFSINLLHSLELDLWIG